MSINCATVTRRLRCGPPSRTHLPPPTATIFIVILVLVLLVASLERYRHNSPRESSSLGAYEPIDQDKALDQDVDDDDEGPFPLVHEFKLHRWTKKFDNEQARIVGFPVRRRTPAKKKAVLIYLATPYFGEWNPNHYYFPHLGQETFRRYACPVDACHVTKDPSKAATADAVLFHVRDLEVFSLPSSRSPDQVWILYSMEPPWLEVRDMRRFEGVFNWTMSYRSSSDLVVRYGFVGRRRRGGKGVGAVPLKVPGSKRNRALWFVSNCNTDSNREGFVERLRKVYPVDVKGGCGTVDDCRPAESRGCYRQMALNYKFYLAFENALCPDYVTEKLFNPLEYFVVPVTLGAGDYASLVPPRSTIDALRFQSPEALGRYLWEVSRNDSLYLSYFEWRRDYRSYLQPWMCDLCEALHRDNPPVTKRTRLDLEGWWHGRKPCLRWTDQGLREVQRHPFPVYHSGTLL